MPSPPLTMYEYSIHIDRIYPLTPIPRPHQTPYQPYSRPKSILPTTPHLLLGRFYLLYQLGRWYTCTYKLAFLPTPFTFRWLGSLCLAWQFGTLQPVEPLPRRLSCQQSLLLPHVLPAKCP